MSGVLRGRGRARFAVGAGAVLMACYLARPSGAMTYYVDQSGSDANRGTSSAEAFRHIAKALSASAPGDTVCIDDSDTYSSGGEGNADSVVRVSVSGTAGKPITLRACGGARPTIDNTTSFYGIQVEADYVTIGPGLHVYGGSDQTTLSACQARPAQTNCRNVGIGIYGHHINVTGIAVDHEGCSGIAGSPDRYSLPDTFDYIDVTNNETHHNANYAAAGCSGISLYELTNVDDRPGYHNHVTGNFSWGNRQLVPSSGSRYILDGNGCIIDDGRHVQHPGLGRPYTGATLLANNLFIGGTGCHAYQTDIVDFFFNTAFGNNQTSFSDRGCSDAACSAELGGYNGASNLRFYNNIAYATQAERQAIGCRGCQSPAADYNLQFGGAGSGLHGPHDIMADPQFVRSIPDGGGDFHLRPRSPAIGTADPSKEVTVDYYGMPRPRDGGCDIGAIEHVADNVDLR
jgi:hypothetical protein